MERRVVLSLVAVLGLFLLICDAVVAQPGGRFQRGQGAQGGPGGFGGNFGQMFDGSLAMLQRDEVRRELALDDAQIADLEGLQNEIRESMRDTFQGFRGGERPDFEKIQEEVQAKMKEIEEEANQILLPHQIKRLEQLTLQNRQQRGATAALESIADKLDISDEQMNSLRAKAEEAQKEFEAKVAKAREEMQNSVLSVLNSDQRQKYMDLIGDRFEFDRNPGNRFGQRDRGDRGENRGDRRPDRGRDREDF